MNSKCGKTCQLDDPVVSIDEERDPNCSISSLSLLSENNNTSKENLLLNMNMWIQILQGSVRLEELSAEANRSDRIWTVISFKDCEIKRNASTNMQEKVAQKLDAIGYLSLLSTRGIKSLAEKKKRNQIWSEILQDKVNVDDFFLNIEQDQETSIRENERLFSPRFLLDFSGANITDTLCDLLYRFFTMDKNFFTSFKCQKEIKTSLFPRGIAIKHHYQQIGLRFKSCRLNINSLIKLQDLFERIGQKPQHEFPELFCTYQLTCLDLSRNKLSAIECGLVAGILALPDVHLEELYLNHVFGKAQTEQLLEAFGAIMATVCRVKSTKNTLSGSLRMLSMDQSRFSHEHVCILFSSLRASTAVKELSLSSALSSVSTESKRTWSWIAYGLFHPYSAAQVRMLNLSGNSIELQDIHAFGRVLSTWNPSLELLQYEASAQGLLNSKMVYDPSTLVYATVPAGTSIRATPEEYVFPCFTLQESTRFEVVHAFEAWIAVMVPGYGIAWTTSHPSIFYDGVSQNGRKINCSVRSLILDDMIGEATEIMSAIIALLKLIGHSLESLQMRHNTMNSQELVKILKLCPNLTHLDIEACCSKAVAPIVQANLEGKYKLVRLNLNNCSLGRDEVKLLASHLHEMPFLKELQIANNYMGEEDLEALIKAIEKHPQLIKIVLDRSTFGSSNTSSSNASTTHMGLFNYPLPFGHLEASIDAEQGRRLCVGRLPLDRKLAFLSVLRKKGLQRMDQLDNSVAKEIFEYASTSLHRQIHWGLT